MYMMRGMVRLSESPPIPMCILVEYPTLDKFLKKSKSFEQNSMQVAADGTKSKNGGWGYGGVWLVGFCEGGK